MNDVTFESVSYAKSGASRRIIIFEFNANLNIVTEFMLCTV